MQYHDGSNVVCKTPEHTSSEFSKAAVTTWTSLYIFIPSAILLTVSIAILFQLRKISRIHKNLRNQYAEFSLYGISPHLRPAEPSVTSVRTTRCSELASTTDLFDKTTTAATNSGTPKHPTTTSVVKKIGVKLGVR